MGTFSLKDKVCVFAAWALMLMCSTAERQYFPQSSNVTWNEARTHCQACFKDMVTLTHENILNITQRLSSDHWIGLRKMLNSTSDSSISWSHWVNGDPLTFQNWYPGWPVVSSSVQTPSCCPCMETNSSIDDNLWSLNETNFCSIPFIMDMNETQNHTEDLCVAVRSFGPWVEKNCSELLPFICYEDRFFGEVQVTNVTLTNATLTWLPGPGNISHYRVEVGVVQGNWILQENRTDLTSDLSNLTAGTHYLVQVFPVKCERSLNPEEVSFYTAPNKVQNLRVTSVNENSITLSWNRPAGNVEVYLIQVGGRQNESSTEGITVGDLTPGMAYTFTVLSGVQNGSTRSEESSITVYTKPGEVTNLTASEHNTSSMMLNWTAPQGGVSTYRIKALNDSQDVLFNTTVIQSQVRVTGLPVGTRMTLCVTALVNDTVEGDAVTTVNYTVPGVVSNLTLNSTHDSVLAVWNCPEGNYSYFNVTLQLNNTVATIDNLQETRKNFTGLKSAANYTVIVSTVLEHLESQPVESSTLTWPLPPKNVNVTSFGTDQITLEWEPSANFLEVSYRVNISSRLWKTNSSQPAHNETNHMFGGLTSGTRYELVVQTELVGMLSAPVNVSHSTVADEMEISVAMLCSAEQWFLCDSSNTRDEVFNELNECFKNFLKDLIFWRLKKQQTNN